MTGQKFNHLTVIERVGATKQGMSIWKCQCDCGNYHNVRRDKLLYGEVKSCGCRHNEREHEDLTGAVFGNLTIIGGDKIGENNSK